MQQELLSGVLVYPIISISGHCHSCSRTALIPELPAKGAGSLFGKESCTLPCLLQLCSPAAQRWQLLQGHPQWESWAWQTLGRGLFSVGDKKEWGGCHLEYVYYWVSHVYNYKHGSSVWNILFSFIFKCYKPSITSPSFAGGEAMGCDI